MNVELIINRKAIFCFLTMFFSGCAISLPLTTNEVANQFVKAVNKNDVQALRKLSESPFYVYSQEWATAEDGYGFVLGKRHQTMFKDDEKLSIYMNTLVKEVKVESVDGRRIPVAEYSHLYDVLGKGALGWESQDIFLFLRGTGDVEHIVILGVNSKTKKVNQLYFN